MGQTLEALVLDLHTVVPGDEIDVSDGEGKNGEGEEPPEVRVGLCDEDDFGCGREQAQEGNEDLEAGGDEDHVLCCVFSYYCPEREVVSKDVQRGFNKLLEKACHAVPVFPRTR